MIDPQTIVGLVSGGLGALITLKVQADKDKHDMMMAALGIQNDNANDANKRGSAWGRRFAIIMIMSVGFGGLFYASAMGIKVSQIVDKEPLLDLFGLIKIGGGQKVVEASGFVIPQYVEDSIISVIFFLFGSGAAKR